MEKLGKRVGASLLGLIVATGLAVSVLPAASAADYVNPSIVKNNPVTLQNGHIDAFNLISTGKNQIRMVLKEDVTGSGVLREPESVTLKVKEQAKMTLPDTSKSAYRDIINDGLTNSFYYLPLTQDQNFIWPGWDSMGAAPALGVGSLNDASCDNVIEKVQAPTGGKVLMWSIDDWGSPASVMSNGKYALPNTIVQPILAHQHINWAFTKAGTYKLTVHSKVTRAADKFSLTTETHVFTFKVAEADKTALNTAITAASSLKQSDYTAASWKSFASALAAAKSVQANDAAAQSDADAATFALSKAQQALVKVASAPKPKPKPKPSLGTPVPVYRVYNKRSGLHHYTTNLGEKNALVKLGWRYEGVSFNAAAIGSASGLKPVYREYNPHDGNHNWTLNQAEHKALVKLGWKDEGTAWYANPSGPVTVYRLYNPHSGEHVYTTSAKEYAAVGAAGWHKEGTAWKGL